MGARPCFPEPDELPNSQCHSPPRVMLQCVRLLRGELQKADSRALKVGPAPLAFHHANLRVLTTFQKCVPDFMNQGVAEDRRHGARHRQQDSFYPVVENNGMWAIV